jgi:hypothetical protein
LRLSRPLSSSGTSRFPPELPAWPVAQDGSEGRQHSSKAWLCQGLGCGGVGRSYV